MVAFARVGGDNPRRAGGTLSKHAGEAPLFGTLPGEERWGPQSGWLRLLSAAGAILIIGAVAWRLKAANLPAPAVRAEFLLMGVGVAYAIPAVILRAAALTARLPVQAGLMFVNTGLTVGVLGIAAPYLPHDFLPLACFVFATLSLNFDAGFGSRRNIVISVIPATGFALLWAYYVLGLHGSLAAALIWAGLLLGVTVLAYLTLRILQGTTQRARDQAESLLRSIGDMGEGIVITERGRLVACNQAYVEMTGYTRDELFAFESLLDLSPVEERPGLAKQLAERLSGVGVPVHYEAGLVRKDGALVTCENSVRILEGDGKHRLIAIVRDVSARRQADAVRAARYAVTRIMAQADGWDEAAPAVIEALCKELGWDSGEFVEADSRTPRRKEGQVSLSFPLMTGGRRIGAIVLRSKNPPRLDGQLEEALADLGSLIGEFANRKRAEAALRASEQRLRIVLESVAEGVLTIDRRGGIVSANPAVRRLFGYSPDELVGRKIQSLLAANQARSFKTYFDSRERQALDRFAAAGAHETTGMRRDGSTFPMEILIGETRPADQGQYVVSLRDVTERKAHMDALEYQALHDALTGLPNRMLFSDRLSQALQVAAREQQRFAVLLLDLDNFKDVNDALGHEAGDRLLATAADRLRGACRAADTVSRLGGDEFGVLMSPGAGSPNAKALARKMLAALEAPFELAGRVVDVRASIGIAEFPEHGMETGTLLRHADAAMYAAKRAHAGLQMYTPDQERAAERRVLMIGQLRTAISEGYLDVAYQPIVELPTGRPAHLEALVRWDHPHEGVITPDVFIPLAEESGSIGQVTAWVAERALNDLRGWLDDGLDLGLSLNVSAVDLRRPEFGRWIVRRLRELDIPPGLLTLEITEGQLVGTEAGATAKQLWQLGVGLAIDDFGIGYSSLSYLRRLPVTQLKIDRSFVERLTHDADSPAIVKSAIELGHGLGLQVVAEGLEDEPTREALIAYSCDLTQGYLVSRPLPRADVAGWVREWTTAPQPLEVVHGDSH